ncbi:PDDEXK family nuclease, partial [Vibrio parahaemolyticus]
MKKYLMTWYGMTDFRASLGLEQTTGPVLGALLAEDYTDVVILGFTHPDKSENKADEFQQKIAGVEGSEQAAARQFIDLFSNTGAAHYHFNGWLKKQLRDAGKKVDVRFHPVELTHLNDTEGIYEAATQSLNAVAASEGEKLVTLYLSPGTPVMAFVWAFAALRHPTLKKRLIASSQIGMPPEKIVLPNEWLEWHGKQIQKDNNDIDHFDAVFHLFGEQRIPSYLGVIQFKSDYHVFVNSSQYPASVMKQFIDEDQFFELPINPYDPEDVRRKILKIIEGLPPYFTIAFNMTGGTKLMYAGALAACRKVNATPFYFDNRSNKTIFLNDFRAIPTKTINSVDTFIKLNSNKLWVSKLGNWEDIPNIESVNRGELTFEIWKSRSKMSTLYKELVKFNDSLEPFELSKNGILVRYSKEHQAEIH